jgi:5,10-methylenetetrahydromethanopterin reductase
MSRVGIGFLSHPHVRGMVEIAKQAEAAGFDSAWVAETRIARDAIVPATAIALGTSHIRVGTAAVNVFTRGAVLTAVTFASLSEVAPGRVVLGLGAGSPEPLAQQGYAFDRPFTRLRETLEAVRLTWQAGEQVDYAGQAVTLEGLLPEVRPEPLPPVYLCTSGPRALRYAGGAADGVVIDVLLPTSFIGAARALLDEGAGGRFAGEVACALLTSVADTRAEAAARIRPTLARYLIGFPELSDKLGIDEDFLDRCRSRAATGGIEAVLPELDDAFVGRFAVCGTAADCRERVEEYRDAGADLPILMPDPDSFAAVVRAFS